MLKTINLLFLKIIKDPNPRPYVDKFTEKNRKGTRNWQDIGG